LRPEGDFFLRGSDEGTSEEGGLEELREVWLSRDSNRSIFSLRRIISAFSASICSRHLA
jgi:hypothetical protein